MNGLAKLSLLLAGMAFWLAAAFMGVAYAQDNDAEVTPAPESVVAEAAPAAVGV